MAIPKAYIEEIEYKLTRLNLHISKDVHQAFCEVPRELFVLRKDKKRAYQDRALPILQDQTISAPHMYAIMFAKEIGDPRRHQTILEIGTGSGYGTALLAKIVQSKIVYSIERHTDLVKFATNNLKKMNLHNVYLVHGDGTNGYSNQKFDRIIITAVGSSLPLQLFNQLTNNGILIMPIGDRYEQWLYKIRRDVNGDPFYEKLMRVAFVPLVSS